MHRTTETAIETVRDYIEALDIYAAHRGYTFAEASYARWFANELLEVLEREPLTPPLIVLESFRDRMLQYSRLNQEHGFIFSLGRDITENIIDSLLAG